MPTYDYRCAACGDFAALRPIAARDLPSACPGCGASAPRVLFAAPMGSRLSAPDRLAHETNERARHEPLQSGDGRLRHLPSCACCGSGARRAGALRLANGAKTFPGRRPWQISH